MSEKRTKSEKRRLYANGEGILRARARANSRQDIHTKAYFLHRSKPPNCVELQSRKRNFCAHVKQKTKNLRNQIVMMLIKVEQLEPSFPIIRNKTRKRARNGRGKREHCGLRLLKFLENAEHPLIGVRLGERFAEDARENCAQLVGNTQSIAAVDGVRTWRRILLDCRCIELNFP